MKVGPQGRVELTPCRAVAQEARPAPAERGAPLTLETVAVEQGGTRVDDAAPCPRVEADGSLAVERGGVVEHLENGEDGVAQRWSFAAPPPGEGDLTVRVRPSGQAFVGRTETGNHFSDPQTGLGFRYGLATWTDASGACASVDVELTPGGDLRLEVPGDVVARSSFPAVLAVTVGPEFGLDSPIVAAAPREQFEPRVAFDGRNYLVVWMDQRAFDFNIFATRVTRTGDVLDPSGILVTSADRDALGQADVAFDGANYLVVWRGIEGGSTGVRGARVATTGRVLDAPSFPVLGSGTSNPALAFDGENYLVVGELGVGANLVAARVTRAGVVLDQPPFVVSSSGSSAEPAVAFDGTNYMVVWTETTGSGVLDIHFTYVGRTGEVLTAPFPLQEGPALSVLPQVAFDGTNYLVVFAEIPEGQVQHDILAKRVSVDATVLDADAIPVATGPSDQTTPAVVFSRPHHVVVWSDDRARQGSPDIYGARVEQSGEVLDPDGAPISTHPDLQFSPALASDGTNLLVVWSDFRSGGFFGIDIFGARVSRSLTVLDPAGRLLSSVVENAQTDPAVATDGTNYLVVWSDPRDGVETEVFGARVSRTGAVLDPSGLDLGVGTLSDESRPAVAWSGSRYLVVWEGYDAGAGTSSIGGVPVTADGTVLEPLLIAGAQGDAVAPRVAAAGGTFLVVWQDLRSGADYDIFGARVSGAGTLLDPGGLPLSTAIGDQVEPAVAGGASFLVAWSDARTGSADIRAARVARSGALLDGPASTGGFVISDAPSEQARPALSFGGSSYFVAWEDGRGGTGDIYGTRVSGSGVVASPGGRPISEADGDQTRPAIAFHGGGFLVAWEDRRAGGVAELFAARLTTQGALQDPDGFLVASGDTAAQAPAVAALPGQVLCAYHRFVPSFATVRVRARLITP